MMEAKGKVSLAIEGGKGNLDLPVYQGTIGPEVFDIRQLYGKTGMFTYDPGFMSTASCASRITYIDGDQGVLLYRGYPIEQLAVNCDFLEVCYLLMYGELPSQSIWILYELGFVAMALFLDFAVIPARFDLRRFEVQQYLRALVRYVALYYALWATADLLILRRNADWAWALRVIPNQLYYGFWVPFAYMKFFSPRYAATRMSVQRSR